MGRGTWTDCGEDEQTEVSGSAVNGEAVVDVDVVTPSASFCDSCPLATFREDGRDSKLEITTAIQKQQIKTIYQK